MAEVMPYVLASSIFLPSPPTGTDQYVQDRSVYHDVVIHDDNIHDNNLARILSPRDPHKTTTLGTQLRHLMCL